jgi:hypothetical protein
MAETAKTPEQSKAETTKIAPQRKWLQELLGEIDTFDCSLFSPVGEKEEGEIEIGVCPTDLRPIYSLARHYKRESERIKVEAKFLSKSSITKDMLATLEQVQDKGKILMAMFWGSVQEHFRLWGVQGALGIREDWVITQTPPSESNSNLPPHLAKLLKQLGLEPM